LIDITTIQKFDPQGMYEVYDRWPELAKESYENNLESVNFSNISHIVFAGMGGSGAIGDIFNSILSRTNIHVSVVKGYLLPNTVNSETLVVTTSISGNTTETLSVLDSSKKKRAKTVAFSSGGLMEDFCLKHDIIHRKISMIHSPRSSFPFFLYSMLNVLEEVIPIRKDEIFESIKLLEKTRERINSSNLTEQNPSLNLARWINGIPIIYYPHGLQAAAIRFKNSLQENAKNHSMVEDVIETCHNGIVSWEKKSNVKPILIEGIDDYVKTKERWMILKKFFDENAIEYREIKSVSGSILSKIINLIYILDYSTIYMAILSGINPTPVESIDFIKKRIR